MTKPTVSDRRIAITFFLWAQILFALSHSGRLHTMDEYEAYYMAESVAEHGTFSIPGAKGFFGKLGEDGKFYAPYGPLPAVLAAPGYMLGDYVARAFPLNAKQQETLRWLTTAATNTTIAAIAVALFFLLARRLGAPQRGSIIATLIFAIATPLWHYATTFFSEPVSTALLLWAAIALTGLTGTEEPSWRRLLLAGLPLGLMALTRLTQSLLFPIPALAVLLFISGSVGSRIARTATYCAFPILGIGIYLTWNFLRFGDALQPGYPETLHGQPVESLYAEPFFRGLYGLTVSPGKGLFLFAPCCIAGLIALPTLARQAGRVGLALCALPLIPIAFYSVYTFWEGGYCWGPRYLLPTLGFWVLPIAFIDWPAVLRRSLVWPTASFGIALQALGVSVSFLECQVRQGYYDEAFQYNTSYAAIPRTWEVFAHYVERSFNGGFLAEAEGLGFDRWFFFLEKGAFNTEVVYGVVGLLSLLFLGSSFALLKTLLSSNAQRPISKKLVLGSPPLEPAIEDSHE